MVRCILEKSHLLLSGELHGRGKTGDERPVRRLLKLSRIRIQEDGDLNVNNGGTDGRNGLI